MEWTGLRGLLAEWTNYLSVLVNEHATQWNGMEWTRLQLPVRAERNQTKTKLSELATEIRDINFFA
eukprot:1290119-Amphidinium_carterae.3